MAQYDPGSLPPLDGSGFRQWALEQFRRIAAALYEPNVRSLSLAPLAAAPARLYEGLTVMADGTNWNPGGGKGVYTYHGGAWQKLG